MLESVAGCCYLQIGRLVVDLAISEAIWEIYRTTPFYGISTVSGSNITSFTGKLFFSLSPSVSLLSCKKGDGWRVETEKRGGERSEIRLVIIVTHTGVQVYCVAYYISI